MRQHWVLLPHCWPLQQPYLRSCDSGGNKKGRSIFGLIICHPRFCQPARSVRRTCRQPLERGDAQRSIETAIMSLPVGQPIRIVERVHSAHWRKQPRKVLHSRLRARFAGAGSERKAKRDFAISGNCHPALRPVVAAGFFSSLAAAAFLPVIGSSISR